MAIKKIIIKNFTIFDDVDIDVCCGVNVFTGGNGTGKTHLLKVIYAWCEWYHKGDYPENVLMDCFDNTINDQISNSKIIVEPEQKNVMVVFIPAKEMLTHSRLEKDYMQRRLPFDATLIDIFNKAGVSELRELPDYMQEILDKIASIIGGRVVYKKDRYFIVRPNGTEIDFVAESEGFKKLGLIYRLVETGNVSKDSILIWDEPESNINPQNIPIIVEILLKLQEIGVQIFIATHDYFLAKYLNIKKTKVHDVSFHALYKENGTVLHESDSDFSMLENNSIIKQSIELYKEEVRKVMG